MTTTTTFAGTRTRQDTHKTQAKRQQAKGLCTFRIVDQMVGSLGPGQPVIGRPANRPISACLVMRVANRLSCRKFSLMSNWSIAFPTSAIDSGPRYARLSEEEVDEKSRSVVGIAVVKLQDKHERC